MIRKDYLKRAIDSLSQALARIGDLRQENETEAALCEVEAAKALLPLVPGVADVIRPENLRQMLGEGPILNRVSALYRQEAELCYLLGNKARAIRCLARAKALDNVEP
jgi:tetratricopeptide (TPR) repeat protein